MDAKQHSSVDALRDRLYAALRHEKSCTCGECSGGLNAVDSLVAQVEQKSRNVFDNAAIALNRQEAKINRLQEQVQSLELACDHHRMFWQKAEERERGLKEQLEAMRDALYQIVGMKWLAGDEWDEVLKIANRGLRVSDPASSL